MHIYIPVFTNFLYIVLSLHFAIFWAYWKLDNSVYSQISLGKYLLQGLIVKTVIDIFRHFANFGPQQITLWDCLYLCIICEFCPINLELKIALVRSSMTTRFHSRQPDKIWSSGWTFRSFMKFFLKNLSRKLKVCKSSKVCTVERGISAAGSK